ncbi:MAG: hypothetical protein AAGD00_05730 [Planctomycetota bacterium]
MTTSRDVRARTRDMLVLAAPLLAVQGVALMIGTSPSLSMATPAAPIAEIDVPAADLLRVDAALLTAAAHADHLAETSADVRSPMMVEPWVFDDEPVLSVDGTPAPSINPAPEFQLTTIMRGRGGEPLARIEGTLASVGHDLGDGWSVVAIDLVGRTVTIGHEDGTESVLTLGPF